MHSKKSMNLFIYSIIYLGFAIILAFVQLYLPLLIFSIASVLIYLFLLGVSIYDLVFICLPFMFYLKIGGAVNTSISDFLLSVWIVFIILKRKKTVKYLKTEESKKTYDYLSNYVFVFVLIMALSMVNLIRWNNPLILQAVISIFKIIVCYGYCVYTIFYIEQFGRKRFLKTMAYSTLFFDVLMIFGVIAYNYGYNLGLTFADTFRATGTFEDPNLAAAYLLLMVSYAIVYFWEKKSYLMFLASIILTFIGVFLTSSKGALAAVLFGVIFIIIINMLKLNIKTVLSLVIMICIISFLAYFTYNHNLYIKHISEPIVNRLGEFTNKRNQDESYIHRSFLWKTAFQLGLTEPILGIGVEQFRPAASQYTNSYVWNIVHNTYLTFFCELGVVGFVAFFRLWFLIIYKHFRLLSKSFNSVVYLFSILCVSVSMWSIGLGNFRSLWVFMTFVLYESFRYNELSSVTTDVEILDEKKKT